MITSTASTSTLTSTDILKALLETKDKIAALKKIANTDWILISPNGEVTKGTVQQLAGELMTHHPLFKDTFHLDR